MAAADAGAEAGRQRDPAVFVVLAAHVLDQVHRDWAVIAARRSIRWSLYRRLAGHISPAIRGFHSPSLGPGSVQHVGNTDDLPHFLLIKSTEEDRAAACIRTALI